MTIPDPKFTDIRNLVDSMQRDMKELSAEQIRRSFYYEFPGNMELIVSFTVRQQKKDLAEEET